MKIIYIQRRTKDPMIDALIKEWNVSWSNKNYSKKENGKASFFNFSEGKGSVDIALKKTRKN